MDVVSGIGYEARHGAHRANRLCAPTQTRPPGALQLQATLLFCGTSCSSTNSA